VAIEERFRVALAAFPPPAGDGQFLALAERFGTTATESPYVDPDPELAEVLVAGQQAGQAKIDELAGQGGADAVNGWTSALHAFDYWLPTPAGAFRPVMRMYQPQQAVLDGTYALPAVRKVG
jgi:hypothetical protein